jgi:hypothetical protein
LKSPDIRITAKFLVAQGDLDNVVLPKTADTSVGAMILLVGATLVKDRVRSMYAQGFKSSNKVYANRQLATDQFLSDAEFNDLHKKEMLRGAISQIDQTTQDRYRKRAGNAESSRNNRGNLVSNQAYDQGKVDLERLNNGIHAGNCDEMACVAAVLVIDDYQQVRQSVFIGKISSPGDHQFLVACENPVAPKVTSVAALAVGGIVIDPWLNIACATEDYAAAATKKLGDWDGKGKRVSWRGADGKVPGWYAPGGDYTTHMWTAPSSQGVFAVF